ncbi:pyridoxal phosphate-dependent aminotransferase [Eubacterium xylanophilum]|uniref:pyridoxal phosphate-dependent aminotransferase n=1 Tax=Eubacterium xylanophilum TaxID=39497 RepID=UPI00047CE13A|nr:pyridoxal phosphate-dependent aminotransferase [Eubacterium xylanophilum]
MIAKKMEGLVKGSSVIRAMFEEGKKMAKKYGAENVYDFSLGNPSVAPPEDVKRAFVEEVENEDPTFLHGYMSNTGYEDVRAAIAEHINELHGTKFDGGNIIMTVGAAGGLNVVLRSLVDPDDEVMVIAPYFGEYDNYVANANGKVVVVAPNPPSFQPNLDEFEEKITARTKVVIINTPNNPTGVVYSEDTLKKMGEILEAKGKEFGTDIYLLSDEPYRELVYDGVEVPYVTKYYANTIVGYSYSKSLSLPGERIGYLVIPSEVADFESVYAACGVATRILGFVNAPSLQQRVIMKSLKSSVDVSIYEKNRNLLLDHLKKLGFEVATPSGAFYLFVKCLEEDDKAFANKAKEENILVVPGSTFGCKGYVRIAYCVDYKMIERALPAFERLAAKYK